MLALDLGNTTIVSPDAGRINVSEQWAAKLGNLPLAFIHKQRDITRPNHAEAHGIIGDVDGRDCVVIDDMVDTAGTICEAVRTLNESGAKSVTLVATDGSAFRPGRGATGQLCADEIVFMDTVPIPEREAPAEYDRTVLSTAAGRGYSLRVRGRFCGDSARRPARGHASAQYLCVIDTPKILTKKRRLAIDQAAFFSYSSNQMKARSPKMAVPTPPMVEPSSMA